ncbi:Cadherin domain containing protein [Aphelenchoides avenae]|nr:Cadherin domain containing protein [Aphelenchus avenae]
MHNDSTVPFKLVMDADSGSGSHVFLELTDELDHEKIASYQLELIAFDGGTPKRNASCHVSVNILDVNDNAPVFENNYTNITVPNGFVDLQRPLVQLSATDADSGSNAAIRYRITHDSTGQFSIDERTGQLFSKVTQLSCMHHTNEVARLCTVTVEAFDHGTPALSSHAYVNIFVQDVPSNQLAIDLKLYPAGAQFALLDESVKEGMTVAVVTVRNGAVDEKGQALLDIEGGNQDGLFRLERGQSFAVIRVNRTAKLKCGTRRELLLKAQNAQQNGTQKPLEIFVRCQSDKGSIPSSHANYTFRVREDTAIGSRIGQIRDDRKQKLRYKLSTPNVPFSIDGAAGVITLTDALDVNLSNLYNLEISIIDSLWSVPARSSFVRIEVEDVNNHAPIFDKQLYAVDVTGELSEEEPLVTVHARDDDTGENQRLAYIIVDHSARPLFRVTTSGRVYARVPWRSLARQRAYFFRIGVRDHGIPSLEGFTNVQLFLKTRTGGLPYFEDVTKYATIRATDQPGKRIVRVHAVDRSGLDGYNLTYILYEASADAVFLGHEDGWLRLKKSQPNVPQPRILTAKIGAVDGRGNPTTNNVTVHITWLPERAETLNCSLGSLKRHVREDVPLGHTLGRVQCHMLESSMPIKYSIEGIASKFFSIDPANGEVRTIQILDRETFSVMSFTVIVGLNGTVAALSGEIWLDDVNDNSPSFTKLSPTELRVGKEVPLGAVIGQLQATDPDAGDNAKHRRCLAKKRIG